MCRGHPSWYRASIIGVPYDSGLGTLSLLTSIFSKSKQREDLTLVKGIDHRIVGDPDIGMILVDQRQGYQYT